MPRKARLNVPGALYHVMSRCLPVYRLFSEDIDREQFLSLFSENLLRSGFKCYAWVLMDNHYHLLLRSSNEELWRLMKPLQMRYSQYHGRKTGRRGPLFMDRFKSIVTQDQNYLMELIRYVHLNPVRAGICKNLSDLREYRWSGHRKLMLGTGNEFQEVKAVLRRFGGDEKVGRCRYEQFLQEGLTESGTDDESLELVRKSNDGKASGRHAGSWVIGDHDFVVNILSKAKANHLRVSRFEREGANLIALSSQVGNYFNVDNATIQVRQRGGAASDARKVFAYVACRLYGAPVSKVKEYLGVGSAAVSALSAQGKVIAESHGIFK